MTIDFKTEKLIPLSEVPNLDWVKARYKGRRLNICTMNQWAIWGLKNAAPLETLYVGSMRCTTEKALRRFFDSRDFPQSIKPTKRQAAVAHSRATKWLDSMGI